MSRLFAVLAASTVAVAAHGATVKRLEPGALAAVSELVFVGTVAAQRSVLEGTPPQVFTETTFTVHDVLKGEKRAAFTLRQLGGDAGQGAERLVTRVPGYARFTVGERVVLFMERAQTGRLVVAGLAQGKYRIEVDPKTDQAVAVRDLDGLHQVGNRPDRWLANVPDPDRMLLADLLRLVAGAPPPPMAPPKVIRPQTRQVTLPEVTR